MQRKALTADEAMEAMAMVQRLAPVRILASAPYQPRALRLALDHARSFYDSLYLAVAETERGLFVTAEERLVNALAATPLARLVHWIGQGVPANPPLAT